jgi:hypothetical protein
MGAIRGRIAPPAPQSRFARTVRPAERAGVPWTGAQLQSFLAIPTRRPMNALLALSLKEGPRTPEPIAAVRASFASLESDAMYEGLRAKAQRDKESFADKQWSEMVAHPVGHVLHRNRAFKSALELLVREQERARLSWKPGTGSALEDLRCRSLTAYNMRLEFFHTAALFADSAAKGEWRQSRKSPTKDQQKSAIKHARGLSREIRRGVRLFNHPSHAKLEELLGALIYELESGADKRVKRTDADSGRRAFLGGLATSLIRKCGWCSPAGLRHLAEAMKVPCNEQYAKRICADRRKAWGRFFAEVLKDNPELRHTIAAPFL